MKILVAIAILALAFLFQEYRFLSLWGVNPNLLLVGLFFFAFKWEDSKAFTVLVLGTAAVLFLFEFFWFPKAAAVLILAALAYAVRNFMTGNRFLDFLIALGLGTVIFYVGLGFPDFDLPYSLIFWEIIYNLAVGVLLWGSHRRLFASS